MIRDFLINASLLLSSFFVLGHMFRKHPVHTGAPLPSRLLLGFCMGLLGLLLMVFSIHASDTVILDLRHIPILIAALFGGFPSSVVSAAVIAAGRVTMFGLEPHAVRAALNMLVIGAVCGALSRLVIPIYRKMLVMNVASMVFITIVLMMNLPEPGFLYEMLPIHWSISIVSGYVALYIGVYVVRSNELRQKLMESERRFRHLIELSPDAIFVYGGGKILFVNKRGCKLLRAGRREELLGKSATQFLEADRFAELKRNVLADGFSRSEPYQQRCLCCDGDRIDVEVSLAPVLYESAPAVIATIRDITERKRTEQRLHDAMAELEKLSNLDGLTLIANRRHFDEALQREWRHAYRNGLPLSLVLLDIDFFKPFNDTFGHLYGDECLKKVALTLREGIKRAADVAARFGGEEFALILPNTPTSGAYIVAEQIRDKIEQLAIPHSGSKVAEIVTVSIGLATLTPENSDDAKRLIELADLAMYQAKAQGRNRIAVTQDAQQYGDGLAK